MIREFPYYGQFDHSDNLYCCIRIIAKYYGKYFSNSGLKSKSGVDTLVSMDDLNCITKITESIGIECEQKDMDLEGLKTNSEVPFIAKYTNGDCVVVYAFKHGQFSISDPREALVQMNERDFMSKWIEKDRGKGIIFLLTPTNRFYQGKAEKEESNFKSILSYLLMFKSFLWLFVGAIFISSLIQLVFPLATQIVVDYGIKNGDISFSIIILLGVMLLALGNLSVHFVKDWILIHLTTRVNFFNLANFIKKLLKLPSHLFNQKIIGDFIQRIGDHQRIDQFLTHTLIHGIFSVFSIIVIGIVLATFNVTVFIAIYLLSAIEIVWILSLLGKIQTLDNRQFSALSENQNKIIEIIQGVQDIKLYNVEKYLRASWEKVQVSLLDIKQDRLKIKQFETTGTYFLGNLQSILVVLFCTIAVIRGNMSIGTMMSIIFIKGQLNNPISHIINFILLGQLAKISLNRLSEINEKIESTSNITKGIQIAEQSNITFENVFFSYNRRGKNVLEDISFIIPKGKITAIVGKSGSGKTTLLKLILKLQENNRGNIKIGKIPLKHIASNSWRSKCSTVFQESFIFSNTIKFNIALEHSINEKKFKRVAQLANIYEFIEEQNSGFETVIGEQGISLSQGQKQRILIARALYRNPDYIFLDEATNSLDAKNEKLIMENLNKFFIGRTVVIVAHRLSTVKNADQIIVLEKGRVVEQGNHHELVQQRGSYYELIKNQLELEVTV